MGPFGKKKEPIRKVSPSTGALFRRGELHIDIKVEYSRDVFPPLFPFLSITINDQTFQLMEHAQQDKGHIFKKRGAGTINFGRFSFSVFQGVEPTSFNLQLKDGGRFNKNRRKAIQDQSGWGTDSSNSASSYYSTSEAEEDPQFDYDKDIDIPVKIYETHDPNTQHKEEYKVVVDKDQHTSVSVVATFQSAGPPKASGNIVTQTFLDIMKQTNVPPEQRAKVAEDFKMAYPHAKDLLYILVPGLFTEHYPLYFKENLKWLQELLGFDTVQAEIDTDASVDTNATVLRTCILREVEKYKGKKVVLIGHSKGGVDITYALMKYQDELQPLVYGVIGLQTPYGGTYVADWVMGSGALSKIAETLIEKIWKGDCKAFKDLALGKRSEIIAQYPFDGEKVPTVAIGSFASFEAKDIDSVNDVFGVASMAMTADQIKINTGFACDGLVAQQDARIPGADTVLLPDMYHTQPALHAPGNIYHSGALMQVTLKLLFDKIDRARKGSCQ